MRLNKILLFLFCICWCLAGCSPGVLPKNSWFEKGSKIRVLSTTAIIDDLVKEIGQDKICHIALITGEVDPHGYELVKGDDEKIRLANIVISNGLNLEHGAGLRHQLERHPHTVFLGDEIIKKVPHRILKVDGELDPHIWMDISLFAEGIEPIVAALSKEDPENMPFYKKNGEKLFKKMLEVHQKIQQDLLQVPSSKRYLVTSHDAFQYFAKAYLAEEAVWQKRCVAPEGLAPEGQLSVKDIQKVVEHLSSYQIGVVFPESNLSRDALKKVASCCKHKVRICKYPLHGDTLGAEGSEAANYLGMIQYNARILKEEWGQ